MLNYIRFHWIKWALVCLNHGNVVTTELVNSVIFNIFGSDSLKLKRTRTIHSSKLPVSSDKYSDVAMVYRYKYLIRVGVILWSFTSRKSFSYTAK